EVATTVDETERHRCQQRERTGEKGGGNVRAHGTARVAAASKLPALEDDRGKHRSDIDRRDDQPRDQSLMNLRVRPPEYGHDGGVTDPEPDEERNQLIEEAIGRGRLKSEDAKLSATAPLGQGALEQTAADQVAHRLLQLLGRGDEAALELVGGRAEFRLTAERAQRRQEPKQALGRARKIVVASVDLVELTTI